MIGAELLSIFLFAALGFLLNGFAYKRGFFKVGAVSSEPITLKQVAFIFLIYIAMMLCVGPYLVELLKSLAAPLPPSQNMLNAVQLFVIGAMIAFLVIFCRAQDSVSFKQIWKNTSIKKPTTIIHDIGIGALMWFLSFPLVNALGEFFDLIAQLVFGMQNYEQVAVQYLKSSLESPFVLTVALTTILLIAPAVEEFLFRGCLQTFFKKYVGVKSAILLSALCFSLFHYSTSQGLGNLSLLTSLFVFGCFLGFVYEKQRSLFASLALHITFNLATSVQILFFQNG